MCRCKNIKINILIMFYSLRIGFHSVSIIYLFYLLDFIKRKKINNYFNKIHKKRSSQRSKIFDLILISLDQVLSKLEMPNEIGNIAN